jgi:DMSO/TMAO reductase YedYZ molybdopterin-dependent catalytic subunit
MSGNFSTRNLTRRRLLQLAGIGGLGLVVEACARAVAPPSNAGSAPSLPAATAAPTTAALPTQSGRQSLPGVNNGSGAPVQTPSQPGQVMITPNSDFYTVYYREDSPTAPANWKLTIGGNVGTPLSLSLDDLKAMPPFEEMRTLECISNPAGGTLISNAVWKGVKLKDLLDRAGVKPNTIEIQLESFDGYSTAIPLDLAYDEHSFLAYEMNGEPLPVEHGKPLRCLWPGRYGMKQPKWLTTITAITSNYMGFWEQQGWSDEAAINPTSRIDVPAENDVISGPTFEAKGIGFSGASGIAKIELSTDNGQTWQPVDLVRGPTPYVWTNWSWKGQTPAATDLTLLARVTDNAGHTMVREKASLFGSTFPNGSAEMHQVDVTVKKSG